MCKCVLESVLECVLPMCIGKYWVQGVNVILEINEYLGESIILRVPVT